MMGEWEINAAEDMALVRNMFLEYSRELGDDFCFQGFQDELATLPSKYAPPKGCILQANLKGAVGGIVALRPYDGLHGCCEMKRMYVRPEFRGAGLGRLLADAIVERATSLGYDRMLLDTLIRLQPAVALYRSLGFKEIDPYYQNPISGVIFMAKDLN